MLLSAKMIRLHDTFGIENTFDLFARTGFEGIDFSNDVSEYYSTPTLCPITAMWIEKAL